MAKSLDTELDTDTAEVRGFDVTMEVVVGRVNLDERGRHNPLEAALLIIAGQARDGVYRFPGPHEDSTTVVTVEGVE